jgi:murein DD-endopeptidase MepM/ murein hydrolase activator NlpD
LHDLFTTDQAEARRGGGFRWFFSTCLAAMVGTVAIGAVIFGSLRSGQGPSQLAATLRQATFQTSPLGRVMGEQRSDGLAWTIPKSDKLQTTTDAVSTRYIVQDSIRERRANRDYLLNKPYARVLIRLAAVEPDPTADIPPFNPLRLFAGGAGQKGSGDGASGAAGPEGGRVSVRVVELLGSLLPAEDGQQIDPTEASELVHRMISNESDRVPIRASFAPEGLDLARRNASDGVLQGAFVTVLHKTTADSEELSEELDGQRVRVRLGRGESLSRLLVRMGSDATQAREMVDTARKILPESAASAGHEVELTLAPSLSGSGKPEPVRYTVFEPSGDHRVTVERDAAGEFVASATATRSANSAMAPSGNRQAISLYSSLYHGALAQGILPEIVQTVLRLHAYESDFRLRARGSDSVELFFDLKDEEKGADGTLGELLATSMTIGGNTQRFYRFKEADGSIDYYDINGNNSRRFLLRKPLRSDDVRLTSGFGIRNHPLLNQRKLHAGIDWAGPVGTPIVAAGNGVVEEAGYKGQYGNYIRIRHANSYQTAYGHMRGLASGVAPGTRVHQGQIIGYLGSTGLSSGPHLHFEVLVGNRWVDPLAIQVPREKRLTGRQLTAFQRERARVDELMRQPPVRVSSLDVRR